MTSIKRNTDKAIFRGKHPRIRAPPTQFQKLCENFKIEFLGDWTKMLISQNQLN